MFKVSIQRSTIKYKAENKHLKDTVISTHSVISVLIQKSLLTVCLKIIKIEVETEI